MRRAFILILLFALPISCMAADPPRSSLRYKRDLIRIAHTTWGLDAPVSVFAAQIHQESAWNPLAVSPVGAQGLAQFMPSTSSWISGLYDGLRSNDPRNPAWSMQALITYDIWLWNRIQAADDCSRMAMALSGYNGGLGWVYKDQALAKAGGADRGRWFDQVERFNAGRSIAAFKENRGYPRNILGKWQPLYATWGGGITC
ncbi:MAG TPA: transglycosylase SLT domain-containing protein [Methylophilaceae bacterium]|nr:transglycosylase SLT domain-containing protein [Methylophilaceae bacterium]